MDSIGLFQAGEVGRWVTRILRQVPVGMITLQRSGDEHTYHILVPYEYVQAARKVLYNDYYGV